MSASSSGPGKSGRRVAEVVQATRTLEGAGFAVRRAFPGRKLNLIDPFLLLDEMGPSRHGPGEAKGAPDHPHRGFETVTYLLDGVMEHRDSQGNHGVLGPGDVQWMTAGAGVVHSEMPEEGFLRRGGRMHGFQLWVNLPRSDKMIPPRYQDTPASRIPVAESPDGLVRARVIAGEAMGKNAVIETRTPILYLHITLEPGGLWDQPVPAGFNAFAYVFSGEGLLGEERRAVADGELALFGPEGQTVRMQTPAEADGSMELLLLAGRPLNEPVARYGPFVMNTEGEIRQALLDLQSGRFGRIA